MSGRVDSPHLRAFRRGRAREIEYLHFLNMDYYVVTQSLAEAAYAARMIAE